MKRAGNQPGEGHRRKLMLCKEIIVELHLTMLTNVRGGSGDLNCETHYNVAVNFTRDPLA